MNSNLAFYQESSWNFPWLYLPALFCNIDFTLQVFQPFRIPIMIYRLHMSPQNFFDFSASGWSSSHLSSSWFSSLLLLLLLLLLRQSICTERFYEFYDKICFLGVANKHSNITHLYSKCTHTHIFTKKFVRENAGHLAASNLTYALNRFKGNVNRHQTRCHWLKSSFFFFLPLKPN